MNTPDDNRSKQSETTNVNQAIEHAITNMEKYENYKTQFERLKKAMDNEFYLEAIFIEYAIIEDRTKSILCYEKEKHCNVSDRTPLKTKLDIIDGLANSNTSEENPNNTVIERYFSDNNSDELLEKIDKWRNDRNPLTHRLMDLIITTEQLCEIAKQGECLCKALSNRANNYKRMIERHKSKE